MYPKTFFLNYSLMQKVSLIFQWSFEQKKKYADYIIDNSNLSLKELEKEVLTIINKIKEEVLWLIWEIISQKTE